MIMRSGNAPHIGFMLRAIHSAPSTGSTDLKKRRTVSSPTTDSMPKSSGMVGSSRKRSTCEKRRPSVSAVNMNDWMISYTGAAFGLVRFTGQSAASFSAMPRCLV